MTINNYNKFHNYESFFWLNHNNILQMDIIKLSTFSAVLYEYKKFVIKKTR